MSTVFGPFVRFLVFLCADLGDPAPPPPPKQYGKNPQGQIEIPRNDQEGLNRFMAEIGDGRAVVIG